MNELTFEKGVTRLNGKPYFMTYPSKVRFFPCNPTLEMINLPDMAHSLSIVRRFGGHTRKGISSGIHSLLVSKFAPPHLKFRAILHDGSDAYCGDMVSPLKHHTSMEMFRHYENQIQSLIYEKFGLNPIMTDEEAAELKLYDLAALAEESRVGDHDWYTQIPERKYITENLIILEDEDVERLYLREFDRLYKERQ